MANPGEMGSGIKTTIYEGGQAIGIKYEGEFQSFANGPILSSSWGKKDNTVKRTPTKENTDSKRSDELKALKLVPFEALDKAQEYANPGDTMPIVFCKRENNAGGVWISPPLLDSSSDQFNQTFVYLISHGQTGLSLSVNDYFVGKQCLGDIPLGSSLLFNIAYTNNAAVCPINGYPVSCDHTNFNFLADPLSVTVGEITQVRTVNRYATGARIRVKPLYPSGSSSPTLMERYTLTVFRTNNSTGNTTTVGTISTDATGGVTSILDSMSAGNYTYTIENTSVLTAAALKPETILIEFRQLNTFPSSYDRTSSYTNIQLLGAEGNMYDLTKAYSPPTELKQLHIFMRNGLYVTKYRLSPASISTGSIVGTTDSSNNFGDLLWYWFRESGKFPNQNFSYIPAYDIAVCALFQSHYNITFNAYLTSSTSFLSYAQSIAPMMLCSFGTTYGIYRLTPLLPLADNGQILSTALTAKESFTDSDLNPDSIVNSIIAGSYSKQYKRTEELLPVNIVVTWRGQDNFNLETNQTTTVRYSDYPASAPEETYDMTEFCTNADHATIFAKYVLATRRYSRHSITFQTARNVASNFLEPLDVVSVSLTRANSAGDSRVETEFYLVDSLEFDQTGVVTVSATQFPVNGSGASIINNSILSGSFVVTT